MTAHFKRALTKFDSLLPKWLRRLIRNPEWQKSSALSASVWLAATLVIFRFVALLGHGWRVNAVVSLGADTLMYLANKFWVWRKRKASLSISFGWSFIWWLGFFGFNMMIAWLLINQIDIGTMEARYALGAMGISLNPLVFKFRDKKAFRGVIERPK